MTAKEFLKKRELISVLATVASFILSMTVTLGGVALSLRLFGGLSDMTIMVGVVVLILGAVTFVWPPGFILRQFAKRHPEMVHVDEWNDLMGSIEIYPCDEISRAAATMPGLKVLADLGRVVNAAIVARELIRRERDKYEKDSPEWVLFDQIYKRLCGDVDEANNKYFRYWKLLVDRMKMTSGYTPETFRARVPCKS